jgi:outer membrane protein assembly factor BamB
MVAILAAFWIFEVSIYSTEMAMFPRFISRMLVYLLLLLVFLGWWLSNRHLLWRDRLLGLVLLFGGTAVAMALADPSGRAVIVMAGFPRLFTAWTAWLLLTTNRLLARQRLGLCAATVLVLGYFTLIRFDGLDGAQRGQLNWRWSPTPEQVFLTTTSKRPAPTQSEIGESVEQASQAAKSWVLQPGDWPDFRSDQRDVGISGAGIEHWSARKPQLVWQRRVGPGWSSMIIVDGHLVTQEQRGELEAVTCYNAKTGEEIWVHEDRARFEEPLAGTGPRGTPAFSDGFVVALGAKGQLNCLTAATGQLAWSHDLVKEAGADVPQWGLSVSPLIVDDLVVVFAGGKNERSLTAYRIGSGDPAWTRVVGELSYSSPHLVVLAGQRQILMHDNLGLHAVTVESGEPLWTYASGGGGAGPMLQPHAVGKDQLLIGAGSGIALLEVKLDGDQWTLSQRWESSALKPDFNDFVVRDGCIYGLDDGILCCIDLSNGRRLWKKGRYGHGQLLLLDSPARLVVISETGEAVLLAANPKQPEDLGRFQAIDGKTWNHPVIALGCLFVRNGAEMACYRLSDQ